MEFKTSDSDVQVRFERFAELVPAVREKLERTIVLRIEQTVKRNLRTDIIGIAEVFHRRYPLEWRKVKVRWDMRSFRR
ncbi:Ger(x)C family spore germination C-terminal domain-containing protein [Thermobacillus sp. ZCTH02-B1]|uniref:Ger(x)C family spore germination C-terminal domain-containing protein n=1 Tax=Thermobacillus sp. ZCTH02-B1 TaxID=1858795 RepID=UPI00345CE35C